MSRIGSRLSALGSQVRLPDGREGTVVYNSLCGVGIKWGRHDPDPADFVDTNGDTIAQPYRQDWPWVPDALLRNPWPGADMECVGEEVEVLRWGLTSEEEE